jgi:hypothetical protein
MINLDSEEGGHQAEVLAHHDKHDVTLDFLCASRGNSDQEVIHIGHQDGSRVVGGGASVN